MEMGIGDSEIQICVSVGSLLSLQKMPEPCKEVSGLVYTSFVGHNFNQCLCSTLLSIHGVRCHTLRRIGRVRHYLYGPYNVPMGGISLFHSTNGLE